MNRDLVDAWLTQLKMAWEAGDPEGALELFVHTKHYYERPFKPGTTQAEIRTYWQDIVELEDIAFDYRIIAIEGRTACVHWTNTFRSSTETDLTRLDGVFVIIFDENDNCSEFRQWWFMEQ